MPTREEKDDFSLLILKRAMRMRIDHMDAVLTYCEDVGLEPEVAATLINDELKSRIEEEAEALRIIPKKGRLPL
jgi:hypothetical protein